MRGRRRRAEERRGTPVGYREADAPLALDLALRRARAPLRALVPAATTALLALLGLLSPPPTRIPFVLATAAAGAWMLRELWQTRVVQLQVRSDGQVRARRRNGRWQRGTLMLAYDEPAVGEGSGAVSFCLAEAAGRGPALRGRIPLRELSTAQLSALLRAAPHAQAEAQADPRAWLRRLARSGGDAGLAGDARVLGARTALRRLYGGRLSTRATVALAVGGAFGLSALLRLTGALGSHPFSLYAVAGGAAWLFATWGTRVPRPLRLRRTAAGTVLVAEGTRHALEVPAGTGALEAQLDPWGRVRTLTLLDGRARPVLVLDEPDAETLAAVERIADARVVTSEGGPPRPPPPVPLRARVAENVSEDAELELAEAPLPTRAAPLG